MAVNYRVVSKKPAGMAGDNEPKYYPSLTNRKTVDLRYLSNKLCAETSLRSTDVYKMAEALFCVIPELLQEGHNVKLGDLGTFSLSLKVSGMDDPEKVTLENVKEVRMNFRASTLVKQRLRNTQFKELK